MAPQWQRWTARAARALGQKVKGDSAGARQVVPYRGYGSHEEVFVLGRVLGNPPPPAVTERDRWWRNLVNALQHLESDEVPGAVVKLRMTGAEHEALTDEEGYFRAWLKPHDVAPDRIWHELGIEVVRPLHPEARFIHGSGHVLIPTASARFGVISDLDDTVIRTDATRLLSMLKRTLLENARTRLPFGGVAEFYAALHDGADGDAGNPIFYVSSSPWNLYPVLTDFLEHQGVPVGPLILRDWGINEKGMLPTDHGTHKTGAIRQILDCYPHLPFILIGDSGQKDPEIYCEIVHEYGDRIGAVYIRDVTADALRTQSIRDLGAEVKKAGSELLLSADTLAAARHAAGRGWITKDAVAAVAAAVSPSGARPG